MTRKSLTRSPIPKAEQQRDFDRYRTGVNDGPDATDNTNDFTVGSSVTVSGNLILDNDSFGADSDVDGDTLTVTAVDGGAGNGDATTNGTYGDIVINNDGTYGVHCGCQQHRRDCVNDWRVF